MNRPAALRVVIPVAILTTVLIGGWYVDSVRARQRSALSGFFETQPITVSSRTAGRVAQLYVQEGDSVRAGQLLAQLEAAPAEAETAARQAAAEQARQQMREVIDGPRPEDIRQQQEMVAQRTAELERLRNGPTAEEIGAARAQLQAAQANAEKVHAGARPQEIAEARAAEGAARARLAQAERGLTAEERGQAKARLDQALARETLARADAGRYERLYALDAVTRQQLDQAEAALREATGARVDAEEGWKRAEEGTPPEEMEQAREDWRRAKAALDLTLAGSRPEDIRAADAQVAGAQQNLRSLLRGSRSEDITAAEARLAAARAALSELEAGSRREQIAQAKAAARSAAAAAQSAERTTAERRIVAPKDGVVERIPVAVGDLIPSGTPVMRLTPADDLWLRVYVPESALANVRVGDEAAVRLDGVSGAPLEATVESIATQGEFTPANLQSPEERGNQVFGVRLRLRRPDPRVKAGMYATVERIGAWKP